jgi:hypothetical protein
MHMRVTCWITKATDTHSEHVIPTGFRRQRWLRERATMLRLYVHCLSFFKNCNQQHTKFGIIEKSFIYMYIYDVQLSER